MRKISITTICLALLVFALAGTSQAWQGRMAGAGDPYGLLADESDLLVNPAGIAQGEGINFYGHYRFTYTDVTSWDKNLTNYYYFDTSGQEYNHNALLGAATPLGPGRFGIFFTYDGMRGDYDGSEDAFGLSNLAEYDLTKDFDNFAVRLLYGLPVMGMDAGFELGMAYRDEMQRTWLQRVGTTFATQNDIESLDRDYNSLLEFMIPYDSHYWELLWKAGMEKALGPLGVNVSVRGGYIISSDNNYEFLWGTNASQNVVDMEGDVTGWRIGSDIWLRFAMTEEMALPFLFSIDYVAKTRDGDGLGTGTDDAGILYVYTHKEESLDLKAGGGVEMKLGTNALLAGGIYYNYLQGSDDASFDYVSGYGTDNFEFPSHQEHRVIVKLAGEMELSPAVTLRMGLEPFYGWVQEDFETFSIYGGVSNEIALNGYRWGIGGSLGGSVSFNSFTMEPFFNVGWQQYDLDGDGEQTFAGVILNLWDMDLSRNEWYIGGGCSFLYDMP